MAITFYRILSPKTKSDPRNKSAVRREGYNPLPTSATPLSEQGFRPNVFEMDGFGIVYLIENAQQFWSGVLWWYYSTTAGAALADGHFRARRYSQNS